MREPGGRRRPAPAWVSGQVAEWLREPGATVASVADGPDLPPDLVEAAARHAAAHPDAMARDRDDAAEEEEPFAVALEPANDSAPGRRGHGPVRRAVSAPRTRRHVAAVSSAR